jgi:signal transduction histidine kinase
LATAISLALETLRLAEEAKQTAIAREQEKAAQQRAAELAKANEALQGTIDAMAEIEDLDEFIPAVLKIVAQTFQAGQTENCAYYEHGTDDRVYLRYWLFENQVFRPEELLALDGDRFATVRRLAGGFIVPDTYLGTPVRERTQTVILDHAAGTPEPEFDKFTCANGWHMELNVPLFVNGSPEAALVIYRPAGQQFTPVEVTLAESLGKQLALAMQANRLATESKSKAVESAIAREQELAAQERAAELAKVNEALRRSAIGLATANNIEDILTVFLREAIAASGASAGAVLRRVNGTEFEFIAILQDDKLLRGESLRTHPFAIAMRERSRRDEIGYFSKIVQGDITLWYDTEQSFNWFPEGAAYHREHGHCVTWDIPFTLGNEVAGYLGLAFETMERPSAVVAEAIVALSNQVAVALELTRLAEEAKQALILEERNRMARDIHDTLAQSFTGIIMQLEATKNLTNPDCSHLQTSLECMGELARLGLAEARRSVRALRLEALETADFPTALRRLLHQSTSSTSICATLAIEGTTRPLSPLVEENLLRIAQEAVTNAVRHGNAQAIALQLVFEPATIHLQIRDDGNGFDPCSTRLSGFGLLGMQERTQQLHGQFHLISQGREQKLQSVCRSKIGEWEERAQNAARPRKLGGLYGRGFCPF